jgi:xanthine dehydrogenase small subunit
MGIVIRSSVRFLLNDKEVELTSLAPDATLLDYLRLERKLRGSKEGCAEGDCGACTVLVGRLLNGDLVYETVNSCIRFTGSLDGCHVVTIEALAGKDGTLHPVQQAMVDEHGAQCGFCTPGIVMSLYGLWMQSPEPSTGEIEKALQGNLCRCTGYEAIIRAAKAASKSDRRQDALVAERSKVRKQLAALADGKRVEIGAGKDKLIIPASVSDLADVLAENPNATIVAGSTDVGLWVTKHMRDISPAVFIGNLAELQNISEEKDLLVIGAGVTYSQAYPYIAKNFPQMVELWDRIGGEQVRNMGTVGGNVANGSPIGDTPPALIALGAKIILNKGGKRRGLPIEDFFLAYGKQDRESGDFVESIEVPYLPEGDKFAVYKVTKRLDEDITAVCGAFRLSLDGAGKVKSVCLAFGGMAATPRRAKHAEDALRGKVWSEAAVEAAIGGFARDFTPLTDMRASAAYRMMVTENLLRRFWLETSGAEGQLRLMREAAE